MVLSNISGKTVEKVLKKKSMYENKKEVARTGNFYISFFASFFDCIFFVP